MILNKQKENMIEMKNEDNTHKDNTDKTWIKRKYSDLDGIADYMAIEIFYKKGYDKMVDLWSVGVIMYECLVGYSPFYANDTLSTINKIVLREKCKIYRR